jgi:hypothetical protein
MLSPVWLLMLSALAACGGRAMFDSEQDQPDPSPSLGGGASGSGPGTTTDVACSNYCSTQARQVCGSEVDDQCLQSCSKELGRQSLDCQKNATRLIDCLVAAYRESHDCSTAEQHARDQCAMWLTVYQGCAIGQPDSLMPTPVPPMSCSGTGSGDAFSCSMSMNCVERSYYDIHCKQNPDGSSSCSCGSTFIILNEGVATACDSGIWSCAH